MKALYASALVLLITSATAQVNFQPGDINIGDPVPLPMIENLYDLEVKSLGDLDGDGDADVVAIGKKIQGSSLPHLWILQNNGGSRFQIIPDSVALSTNNPPLIVDVDGDGDKDVLIFNEYSSSSTHSYDVLLTNQGGFTFTKSTLSFLDTVGVSLYQVLDANNDGYPDLLLNGQTPNTQGYTAIYLNNGMGGFSTTPIQLGIYQGAGFAIMDKNADGYDDIVTVGYDANLSKTNRALINNQNGTFNSSSYSSGALYNGSIFVDDFDGDGHPDFMVSKVYGNGKPVLYINNHPSAGFSLNSGILPNAGTSFFEHFHLMLDIDKDGDQDILARWESGSNPDTVVLYRRGPSGFSVSSTTHYLNMGNVIDYDTIDVDGDGYTDVYDPFSQHIFYNDSTAQFELPQQFDAFDQLGFFDFEKADVNGDGVDDFLLSVYGDRRSGVYENQSGTHFKRLNIPFFDSRFVRSIHAYDADGDGDADYTGVASGDPYVLKNNGNGTYTHQYLNPDPCDAVLVFNYDNQHHPDLLLVQEDPNNSQQNELRVYVSNANGSYTQATVSGFPKLNNSSTIAVGDVDNDGLDDVYIGYPESQSTWYGVFINEGNSTFTKMHNNVSISDRSSDGEVEIVDIDQDGVKEVVGSNFDRYTSRFRIGNLDTTGASYSTDPDLQGGRNSSFSLGDLNSDGRLDGAVYNTIDDELYYFLNLPNGDYVSYPVSDIYYSESFVELIDYDNDGDLDLFCAGRYNMLPNAWRGRFYENVNACSLVVQYDSITTCDASYTWIDGVEYVGDTAGVWFETTAGASCISLANLYFDRVQISGDVNYYTSLTLNALDSGMQYQWVDCNNNYAPINGETGQLFSPISNGSYAVVVSSNGCTDTSACYDVVEIGLEEASERRFVLYPSPASAQITLEYAYALFTRLDIVSSGGQAILSKDLPTTGRLELDISKLPSGVYVVRLTGPKQTVSERLIVIENG